jgi:hypothetical protein
MDDSRHVKEELERFVNLMGLDRLTRGGDAGDGKGEYLNNNELLCMYLAWSVIFTPWTLVYKAMEGLSLSLDQLSQAARKTGHSSLPTSGGARQIRVAAQLFCGAAFSDAAKQTVLYQELQAALAPIHQCAADPSLEVLAFYLVGTSNVVALVEDPQSPFVLERMSRVQREMLVDALRDLNVKWSINNPDQVSRDAATMIQECSYPVLNIMEVEEFDILDQLHKRQQRSATRTGSTGSTTTKSAASLAAGETVRVKNANPNSTRGVHIKVHATQPWTMANEREWADYAPFAAYKRRKGWRPFYPARDTALAYLTDMSAGDASVTSDCKGMTSQEVIEFVRRLAPHVEGAAIFAHSQQGTDFLRAMSATATLQQMGGWTTLDAAQRLLVVHRPDWQTHYDYAWHLDRTTSTELAAYLQRWPRLPEKLLAEQEQDD